MTELPYDNKTSGEKYGPGRGQSVFRDVSAARSAVLEALNEALSRSHVTSDPDWAAAFPSGASWWERADYWVSGYEKAEYTQVVKDTQARDSIVMKMTGDLVRVSEDRQDPAAPSQKLSACYHWSGSEWTLIGVSKGTVKVLSSVFSEPRSALTGVLDFLATSDFNRVVFSALYEMLAQNPDCSWFFKTSYVDLSNSVVVGQPETRPQDELPLVIQSLEESKPFRTKVRDVSTTVRPESEEEASASVADSLVNKITLLVDRLNSNVDEDFTWDSAGWDSAGWDEASWTLSSRGTSEYLDFYSFSGVANVRDYVVPNVQAPFGVLVQRADGAEAPPYTLRRDGTSVVVSFARLPGAGREFVVKIARGAVDGSPAPLPDSVVSDHPWMKATQPSYENAAARTAPFVSGSGPDREVQRPDDWESFDGWTGEETLPDGGDTEERARVGVQPSAFMKVTTEHTPVYATWDATPWDSDVWDSCTEYAPYEFTVVSGGPMTYNAAGYAESVDLYEDVTVTADMEDASAVTWSSSRVSPASVSVDSGSGFEELDPSEWEADQATRSLLVSVSEGDTVRLFFGSVSLLDPVAELRLPHGVSAGTPSASNPTLVPLSGVEEKRAASFLAPFGLTLEVPSYFTENEPFDWGGYVIGGRKPYAIEIAGEPVGVVASMDTSSQYVVSSDGIAAGLYSGVTLMVTDSLSNESETEDFNLRITYSWMHPDAVFAAGFEGGQYWLDSAAGPNPEATQFVTTRSSPIILPDADGVYQSLGNNALPRTDRGLYANGQVTNLALYSTQFDNAAWSKNRFGSWYASTVVANSHLAPDGTLTADEIIGPVPLGSNGLVQRVAVAPSTTYTFSIFVKNIDQPEVWRLFRTLNSGVVSRNLDVNVSAQVTTEAFTRITYTVTTASSGENQIEFGVGNATGSSGSKRLIAWGAQIEESSFASPLIVTASTAATLMASDIRAVQGVRPSNSQPEPFPGWEDAGLDNEYTIRTRVTIKHLNSTSARAIASIGIGKNNQWRLYFDTDNKVKFKLVDFPLSLFSDSQPGLYLDGEDNSVMWQDAAGTTPVTALGQPVGLILDKRLWGGKTYAQVMAEQVELNANPGGPFVSLDGYTGGSTPLALVDGKVRLTTADTVGSKRIEYTLVTTPGKTYRVKFRAASTGASSPRAVSWTNVVESPDVYMSPTLETYEVVVTATSTSSILRFYIRSSGSLVIGEYVELEFLEISEIPGNHAYQTTSGSRPLWQEDDNGARGLKFDGVDDWLVTPSIDFSASDKMLVSAGVRKLSDAAIGVVGELGNAGIGANTGLFSIAAPMNTSTQLYGVYSRGTGGGWATTTSAQFPAPHTAILTGQCDIGGDSVRLRVNGSQVAENTNNQGTGNYGNYPLYIGMRGGSSLPYNGFIHQLVVRGGDLPDADELARLEAYIGDKSKTIDANILQSGSIVTPGTYDIVARCKSGHYSLGVSGGIAGDTNNSDATITYNPTTLVVGSNFSDLAFNDWIESFEVLRYS